MSEKYTEIKRDHKFLALHAEPENNICAICGGIKRLMPSMITQVGESRLLGPVRFCSGHSEQHPPHKYCPKCDQWRDLDGKDCGRCGTTLVLKRLNEHPGPAEKHNGRLDDEDDHAVVRIDEYPHIHIADNYHEAICLTPKQALSLLDWLLQERDELTRLAKEHN